MRPAGRGPDGRPAGPAGPGSTSGAGAGADRVRRRLLSGPHEPRERQVLIVDPHGVDHFDATFARDLMWARQFREQLAELPTTDEEPGPQER